MPHCACDSSHNSCLFFSALIFQLYQGQTLSYREIHKHDTIARTRGPTQNTHSSCLSQSLKNVTSTLHYSGTHHVTL